MKEYFIGAGDTIEVTVFGEEQLSQTRKIDATCMIQPAWLEPIDVCGRSSTGLSHKLEELYRGGELLVDPHIAVQVTEYGSQKVEVLGEVKKVGAQFLDGPRNLQEVIDGAGGPSKPNVVTALLFRKANAEPEQYDLADAGQLARVWVQDGDRVVLEPGMSVYVEGEVEKPGAVPYRDGITVTQALTLVGGPGEFASKRKAWILRSDGTKVAVKLSAINSGRAADISLGPEDRLIIRRSAF